MSELTYVIVGLLGVGIGSFLNVISLRLRTSESIVRGESKCLSCGERLAVVDLIPVISFFALRGRCRRCGSRISWQYPLVELLTGALFVLVAWKSGFVQLLADNLSYTGAEVQLLTARELMRAFVVAAAALVVMAVGVVLSVYDIRHKIIPDALNLTLTIAGAVYAFTVHDLSNLSRLEPSFTFSAAVLAAGFFWALWAISKGTWMGLGDAKLVFGIALFSGPLLTLVSLLLAFWIGAIWGIIFLLVGAYNRKSQIPFGPFLFAGAVLAFAFGYELVEWYTTTIVTLLS